MNNDISSKTTFYYKVIMPMFFMGLGLVFPLIKWDSSVNGEATHFLYFPFAFYLLFIILVFTLALKLKTVKLKNNCLVIRNYSKEISIPFTEIKDLKQVSYQAPNIIKIILNSNCEFGKNIYFIPVTNLNPFKQNPFEQNPVVNKIKELIIQ